MSATRSYSAVRPRAAVQKRAARITNGRLPSLRTAAVLLLLLAYLPAQVAAQTAPAISSAVAANGGGDNIDYNAGDSVTITFDMATDRAGASAGAVLDKAATDALLTSSASLGADYSAQWTAADTLVITIADASGAAPPAVGSTTFTVAGDLKNAAGDSAASTSTSPALTGSFASAAVIFSAATLAAVEAAGTTVDVVLSRQPTADVDLTLTAADGLTATPDELSFTPGNWDTPQTVTVSADDDDVAQGTRTLLLSAATASLDASYQSPLYLPTRTPSVRVYDDDHAAVLLSAAALSVAEGSGGAASYTVVLTSEPTSAVSISASASDGSQLTISGSPLTFNALTWQTPQTVTVTAADDSSAEAAAALAVTHSAASSDAAYDDAGSVAWMPAAAGSIAVSLLDNDVAAVLLTPAVILLAEGGAAASYDIILASQPADSVTVTATLPSGLQLAGGGGGGSSVDVTFTTANWNVAQSVSVQAVDGGDAAATSPATLAIAHTVASSDAAYDSGGSAAFSPASAAVSARLYDDDAPAIALSPAAVAVGEGGDGSYAVVLTSQPARRRTRLC
eukprot:PLAT3280.13.p1 GENE.PLAT3280.13~~PLAT3280.13.p1  ORF type:complete len:603 (-),score=311.41 PLAT3280.13:524-2224(-)